jgi:hypothetical protein
MSTSKLSYWGTSNFHQTKFIKQNWKQNSKQIKNKFKWNWTKKSNEIENQIQMKLKTKFIKQNSLNGIKNKIHQIKFKPNSNEIEHKI